MDTFSKGKNWGISGDWGQVFGCGSARGELRSQLSVSELWAATLVLEMRVFLVWPSEFVGLGWGRRLRLLRRCGLRRYLRCVASSGYLGRYGKQPYMITIREISGGKQPQSCAHLHRNYLHPNNLRSRSQLTPHYSQLRRSRPSLPLANEVGHIREKQESTLPVTKTLDNPLIYKIKV